MLRFFLTILIFTTASFSIAAQEKTPFVYQIKAVYQNADLDAKAIERYQKRDVEWNDTGEVLKLFKPVKGRYKVILFMAAVYGLGFDDKNDIFHNILILKANKNNEILDGFEYTLEWAEVPTASRLARITKPGVKLKKGLPVSQLGFKSIEAGQEWELNGIIDNLYNFEQIFDAKDFMMGKVLSR